MGKELDILLEVSLTQFDEDDEKFNRQLGGISIEILKSQMIKSLSLSLRKHNLTIKHERVDHKTNGRGVPLICRAKNKLCLYLLQ